MSEVIPVSIPQVDWSVLRGLHMQDLLTRSPTKILDDAGITTRKPADYVATLGCIHDPEAKYHTTLRRSDLLAHLSFGVMIASSWRTLVEFVTISRIPCLVASNRGFVIATTTLDQWRSFCLLIGDYPNRVELIEITNKVQLLPESAGLGSIFYGYSKKPLNNGLFQLCQQ